ncbi:SDR family NAD(P)-dependent oxidoreductase [Hellea sp.]|nr:SDR family NAD(P)-dependent oxidoreductase [Hellea sp.]MDC1088753.1 SDR family NAD(P)-dependent oxidoreductase [Hellea sp.]
MKNLSGKTAVITGAAQGIGFALAQQCAAEGMKIVMTDIADDVLQISLTAITETGADAIAVKADVSKLEDWEKLKKNTLEAFGSIDVLINNAGILGVPATSWEQRQKDWDLALGVNLHGVINGIRTFIPLMRESGDKGHIVNVASVAGHVVQPFTAPYHVTKFGVTALTESLFHELDILGSNIGVTLVCPGFTKTNILSGENLPFVDEDDEQMKHIRTAFTGGVEGGISADAVAEQTVQAIKDNRFYVFTSPGTIDYAEKRFNHIVRGEQPGLGEALRSRFVPEKTKIGE